MGRLESLDRLLESLGSPSEGLERSWRLVEADGSGWQRDEIMSLFLPLDSRMHLLLVCFIG